MSEHTLQSQIVRFLRLSGFKTMDSDVMSALRYLPPADKRRVLYINQHKNMGYTQGQPDLVVICPEGKVVFVELKNGKAGRQSKEQKAFEAAALRLGHDYRVWRSIDDAVAFVEERRGNETV